LRQGRKWVRVPRPDDQARSIDTMVQLENSILKKNRNHNHAPSSRRRRLSSASCAALIGITSFKIAQSLAL
jgi:hypothetical protein